MLWLVFLPVALANILLYFVCSFVAWDMNPYNWFIFNGDHIVFARIIIVCIEGMLIVSIPMFWKIFDDEE